MTNAIAEWFSGIVRGLAEGSIPLGVDPRELPGDSLRVYMWEGHRLDSETNAKGSHSTKEIVAAHSQYEAARFAGAKTPGNLYAFTECRNYNEMRLAKSKPGYVFWRPLHDRMGGWRAVPPKIAKTEQ